MMDWMDWKVAGEMDIGELIALVTLGLIMMMAGILWEERR